MLIFRLKDRIMRFFVFLLVLGLSCIYRPVIKDDPHRPETRLLHIDINKSEQPERLNYKYLGKFKVTFYWIVEEKDYTGPKTTPLFLENGKLLGYFPSKFVSDFRKESCAELKDGRRISYLKKKNKVRIVSDFLGYGGYTLKPFISVATDPKIIPTGSKLYIPDMTKIDRVILIGLNDKYEPGIVYAHDIGSMVCDHHIDFFVGNKRNIKLFNDAGIESSGVVDVYLIE